MAEKQSAHRQELEKKVIATSCHNARLGPILGFIICMTAIGGGIFLIQSGKGAAGLASIVTALASLAVVFVYGRTKQKEELKQQQANLPVGLTAR